MQAIPFSETISSYCKQFFLMETVPLSESNSFYWKPFLSVEAMIFNSNDSCQWKLPFLENPIPFSGCLSFPRKNFFLMKVAPLSTEKFFWVEAIPLSHYFSSKLII